MKLDSEPGNDPHDPLSTADGLKNSTPANIAIYDISESMVRHLALKLYLLLLKKIGAKKVDSLM